VSEEDAKTSDSIAIPRFEPIVTERLIIRAPIIEDLDPLVARRNDPDVAFYQDWPLPYLRDRAEERLKGTIEQGGPANDRGWMATVTLRDDPKPIGDVYIGPTSEWRSAEVGYSFVPECWGKGYASEALDAVLSYLFDERGILRATASFHPDNIASAMVLERAGFLWEGQTKLSFWLDDRPEPENSDDGWYGLVKADREAWINRPTGPADDVSLVDITNDNQRDVAKLTTHKSQERLVAPVLVSYANALFPDLEDGHPVVPRMWAIEADGELAGFVMIAEQTEHHTEPYLWRMLIDRRFQRRGIGDRAVDLVEEYCRAKGATSITVSWEEGKGSPAPFYLKRGYVPTGDKPYGEVEARKQL
jgi:RimJ/RimL family protein N-acetyltransferase